MCWIKVHRKLLEWEWSDDPVMMSTWMHLLMLANYEEKKWHGEMVPRGSFITSRKKLAKKIGITERQVRTCLSRLSETGEIGLNMTNKYTMITICKYDTYQVENSESDHQTTSKRPANDQQTTTTKEIKKEKKERIKVPGRPESVEEVAAYCKERNNGIDPEEFFYKNESVGWVDSKGRPYKNWKAAVITWENFRKRGNKTDPKPEPKPTRTYRL